MTTTAGQLTQLTAGTLVPFGGDRFTTVDERLAAAFQPGDRLYVVHDDGALLHVPAAVSDAVTASVTAAVDAAQTMRSVPAAQVAAFYRAFADGLVSAWDAIADANAQDVTRAEGLGRSTTRLRIDAGVRDQMADGLRGWADLVEKAASDDVAPPRVTHDDWYVDVVTAPLGVIGFVFTSDPAVAALVQPALIVLAVAQPVCGVVFVLDGVLIGAGDGRYLALAGVANLVPFAPALVVIASVGTAGAAGLAWLAASFFGVYMLARLVTLGLRVRGERWLTAGR